MKKKKFLDYIVDQIEKDLKRENLSEHIEIDWDKSDRLYLSLEFQFFQNYHIIEKHLLDFYNSHNIQEINKKGVHDLYKNELGPAIFHEIHDYLGIHDNTYVTENDVEVEDCLNEVFSTEISEDEPVPFQPSIDISEYTLIAGTHPNAVPYTGNLQPFFELLDISMYIGDNYEHPLQIVPSDDNIKEITKNYHQSYCPELESYQIPLTDMIIYAIPESRVLHEETLTSVRNTINNKVYCIPDNEQYQFLFIDSSKVDISDLTRANQPVYQLEITNDDTLTITCVFDPLLQKTGQTVTTSDVFYEERNRNIDMPYEF